MNLDREREHLWQLEYGDRTDIIVRFSSVLLGAALLYFRVGWVAGWVWLAGYILGHVLYIGALRHLHLRNISLTMACVIAAWAALLGSLLWMPAYLITQDEPRLIIAGVAALGACVICIVRRGDTYLPTVVVGCIAVAASVFVALTGHVFDVENQFDIAVLMMTAALLVYYFAQAVVSTRSIRLANIAATERTVQEEKLAAIGRLAGGVAHDFNNILTGLSGHLELYFEVDDPDEKREMIENAQNSAHRAEALVKQLLVYARQSELDAKRIEARSVMDELAGFSRRLVPVHINIEVVHAEDELWINADRHRLVTALINLVVNAADAMPDGGSLTMSVELLTTTGDIVCIDGLALDPGAYVAMAITDTGTGISPDIMNRVVEPFFTTKPVGAGTGLGLPMVMGLAQSHHGGLDIASSPDGTKVSIMLPQSSAEGATQLRDQDIDT